MATITPVAFNTGSTIPGTTQIGNLSVGTTPQDYGGLGPQNGLTYYSTPDQDLGYVIAHEDLSGGHNGRPGNVPAYVGFWRCVKTDAAFIDLAQYVSRIAGSPQTFATTLNAYVWLITNGYWTSFPPLVVTIGSQIWTTTNLDVTTYRNGDIIPQVTDGSWISLTTGAWCYYNNDPANGDIYGKLYNWYAVNDVRGLAPVGYHIPTDAEFTTLSTFLGGQLVAGGKMKSTSNLWSSPNEGATNESGFTGLPGGRRSPGSPVEFDSINNHGFFWSATQYDSNTAWCRDLYYIFVDLLRYNSFTKNNGFSVRLIKD